MKIFISWSGEHGSKIATALRDWLPDIFHGVKLFLSSEDIRKGQRWLSEIGKQLDETHFGICCLTPDSRDSPWLVYEAGALSKSLKDAHLFTVLFGVSTGDLVESPLAQFQHTFFKKCDVLKLLKSINSLAVPETRLEEERLMRTFDKFWPDLEIKVSEALAAVPAPTKQRSSEEMLVQLLEVSNNMARSVAMLHEKVALADKRSQDQNARVASLATEPPFGGGEEWRNFLLALPRKIAVEKLAADKLAADVARLSVYMDSAHDVNAPSSKDCNIGGVIKAAKPDEPKPDGQT